MSGGMTNSSAIPGPASPQPQVTATKMATVHAQAGEASHAHPDLAGKLATPSAEPLSHPSLTALARLLARQISHSGGGDG